jgi:hypothetical protein
MTKEQNAEAVNKKARRLDILVRNAEHSKIAMRCISDGTTEPLNERLAREIGIEHYLNAMGFYAVKDAKNNEVILADKYKVLKHHGHNIRIYLDINTGKYYSLAKVKI